MKIILLFGPGEVSKRNYLLKIKKEFSLDQTSLIDLKQESLAVLELQMSSGSLFSNQNTRLGEMNGSQKNSPQDTQSVLLRSSSFEDGERLVVVENVPDKMDLEAFKKTAGEVTLVLLAAHPTSTAPILQTAKKLGAKIYSFEGEKELTAFPFLDNLIEGKKEVFLELDKLLLGYGGMYTLTMIYYLLRRNILPLPSSDFMKKKIQKQKQEFSLKDFEKFYQKTLETEFKIKSGLTDEKNALTSLVRQFT